MARNPAFLARAAVPELADSNEVYSIMERAARFSQVLSVRLNRNDVYSSGENECQNQSIGSTSEVAESRARKPKSFLGLKNCK